MSQPRLIPKPFAENGLRNEIQDTRTSGVAENAATYNDGFPQITMTPIAAGGKPPSGKDMNGILFEMGSHIVYGNKGGMYLFDQSFSSKIGGYPKGSVLINNSLDALFMSLQDGNFVDFNRSSYAGKWKKIASLVVNNLTTNDTESPLSAAMGKKLNDEKVGNSGDEKIYGRKTFVTAINAYGGINVSTSESNAASNYVGTLGGNDSDIYLYSRTANKYLALRHSGELTWGGQRVLVGGDIADTVDAKPANAAKLPTVKAVHDYGQTKVSKSGDEQIDGTKTFVKDLHGKRDVVLDGWAWPKVVLASTDGEEALLLESGGKAGTHALFVRKYVNGALQKDNVARYNLPAKTGTHTLATTGDFAVTRKDYNRTITPPNAANEHIDIVGSVHIHPDGSVVQYYHLKQLRDFWFANGESGVGYAGAAGYQITLDLWTAMPNQILGVNADVIRATSATMSQTYRSEANEQRAVWSLRQQGANKGRVVLDLGRINGDSSEYIDILVRVEGY